MSAFQPIINLIDEYNDVYRPVRTAVITDVSQWAATGAAFVSARLGGVVRQMVYRDMPQPTVGQVVSVIQMSANPASDWLVLPIPQSGVDLLFSAFDVTVYSDETLAAVPYASAIIKRDSATGHFSFVCDHPITATNYYNAILATTSDWGANRLYARSYPLRNIKGRLYTWVWWLDQHAWDHNGLYFQPDDQTWGRAIRDDAPNCWLSTDSGATWTASGSDLYGLRFLDECGAGTIYAVVQDGKAIVRSTDSGASWTQVYTYDGVNLIHECAADPTNADGCSWTTRQGAFSTDDNFATTAGPFGPQFWFSNTNVDDFPHGAILRHGGQTLTWSGDWNIPNATQITGSDKVPYTEGTVWAGANPLTSMSKQQAIVGPISIGWNDGTYNHPEGVAIGDLFSHFVRDGSDLYLLSQATPDGSIYKSTDGGATWTSELPTTQQRHYAAGTVYFTEGQGPGAAAGLVRTAAGLWAGASEPSIYNGNQFHLDYDPVTDTTGVTGKQRLYFNDGSGWVEHSDPLFADTSTDPDGNTGRQYVWFAWGMCGV